ncbi:RNA polymerase sigma factor [Cohnella lupini]|uniref:RNA polymerase sigma-70 factor (ECF subfamily) n=1 Tax=Cohnella lupini TaxID=1294267 RepID=A0A3D9IND9_9BACL|nr:RNA polymerase sigma factor [Cohnella lupini]RED63228.1 RNA polymerase sigma-70 factor (ECF subfamily) [Cohnella lupini]
MGMSYSYESMIGPHLEDIRRYCRYLTKSEWDGEDLFQDALLKAMVYFRNKEPYDNVKPLLLRVARHLWIDQCRSLARRKNLQAQLEQKPTSGEDSNYSEVRGMIEWLAGRLPRRNVEMWLLTRYFGYSMQETAELTGSTVFTVKSVLHRTRLILLQKKWKDDAMFKASNVIRPEVERWSQAILHDRPQYVLSR